MATETWYLLKDGTYADPSDCSTGKDGVLRHKNGQEVAMRDNPNVPSTRSVDADAERAKGKRKAEPEQVPETVEIPEDGGSEAKVMTTDDVDDGNPTRRRYKTRDMKAK